MMQNYFQTGREKEIFGNVLDVLKKHLSPARIILFGSRVKGNFDKSSDFDFAVESEIPGIDKQRVLSNEIEALAGLYNVDIVYLNEVEEEFKNLVLKLGKVVYERGN